MVSIQECNNNEEKTTSCGRDVCEGVGRRGTMVMQLLDEINNARREVGWMRNIAGVDRGVTGSEDVQTSSESILEGHRSSHSTGCQGCK
mgnify:CR=1 FL=1